LPRKKSPSKYKDVLGVSLPLVASMATTMVMGFSMGTSTLVGQALDRNRPQEAVAVTRATIHIVLIYMFFNGVAVCFHDVCGIIRQICAGQMEAHAGD